jgi:hypothetical protein
MTSASLDLPLNLDRLWSRVPDGHFKLPHLWSRKLLHLEAGQRWFLARFRFARKGFGGFL